MGRDNNNDESKAVIPQNAVKEEQPPASPEPDYEERIPCGDDDHHKLRIIGHGLSGKVYLGGNKRGQRKAIKEFSLKGSRKSRNLNKMMFDNECDVYEILGQHPFLLEEISGIISKECISMIMPYCPGGDLEGKLNGLTDMQIWTYFKELLDVMDRLYEKKVVHLDVKPANILLGSDGHIRLVDFGLSRILSGNEELIGKHGGTKYFQPPECFSNGKWNPFKVDAYAVGMTLLCMVNRKIPDQKFSDFQTEKKKWDNLPRVFRLPLFYLLQPDPELRPTTKVFRKDIYQQLKPDFQ